MKIEKIVSLEQQELLIKTLKKRFEKNIKRHLDIEWTQIELKLRSNSDKLWSLNEMELSGGEPDVVYYDENKNAVIFYDCSDESPKERRSVCYDREALEARKENKPKSSAMDMADAMGIEILTEAEYRALQQLGDFDLKTSSWLKTPDTIRKLGGAIFGDKRYNNVFIYHNGVQSYYAARGFRGKLIV